MLFAGFQAKEVEMRGSVRSVCFAAGLFIVSAGFVIHQAGAQTSPVTQRSTVSGTTPATMRIPAGISFSVRLMRALDSRVTGAGTHWDGILVNDIVGENGMVYAYSGEVASGVVSSVQPQTGDHPASMSLRAQSLNGIELQSMDRTSSSRMTSGGGYTAPSNRINLAQTPAGTSNTGAKGFAEATAGQGQLLLSAGTVLNFQTTAP
jgi:hypothetical protein